MEASRWVEQAGKEVVVRVRAAGEGWGPPWRLVVPERDGDLAWGQAGELQPSDGGSAVIAIHAPGASSPGLVFLPPLPGKLQPVSSWPTLRTVGTPGLVGVGVGTQADCKYQYFSAEASRELDLYF